MENKVMILGLLWLFLILGTISFAYAVALGDSTCTTSVTATTLANNVVLNTGSNTNFSMNFAYDGAAIAKSENLTYAQWNFTSPGGNEVWSAGINKTTSAATGQVNTTYNVTVDTTTWYDREYTVNLTAGNSTTVFCSLQFTGVAIDNSNINQSSVDNPADITTITNTTTSFRVTATEHIENAVLFLNGNYYTMTISGENKTIASLVPLNVPEGGYTWYVEFTDTDGSTKATTTKRSVIFDYEGHSNQIVPQQISGLQDVGQTIKDNAIIVIFLIIAYFWIRKRGK